jgi:hypothetical protein
VVAAATTPPKEVRFAIPDPTPVPPTTPLGPATTPTSTPTTEPSTKPRHHHVHQHGTRANTPHLAASTTTETAPTALRRHRHQRATTARAKANTDAAAKKLHQQAARIASKAKRTITRAAKAATRQTPAARANAESKRHTDKAYSRALRRAIRNTATTTSALSPRQRLPRYSRHRAPPVTSRHHRHRNHRRLTRKAPSHVAAAATIAPAIDSTTLFRDHFALHGNAFNPDTGQLAEYIELNKYSEGALWIDSCKQDEFNCLC